MFVVVILACGLVGYFSGLESFGRGEYLRALCFAAMALASATFCLNVILDCLAPRYSLVAVARRVRTRRQPTSTQDVTSSFSSN